MLLLNKAVLGLLHQQKLRDMFHKLITDLTNLVVMNIFHSWDKEKKRNG